VIVPVPVPALVKVRAKVGSVKVAVTDLAALMVTMQEPVPVHAPLQPVNVEPTAAVAVRVTDAPLVKPNEQVAPQVIPAGELVTVPLPVPALTSVIVAVVLAQATLVYAESPAVL